MYQVYVCSLWFVWFDFYVYFHYWKGRHQGWQIWTITTQISHVICVYQKNLNNSKQTQYHCIVTPIWNAHNTYFTNYIKWQNYSSIAYEFSIYRSLLLHAIPLSLPVSLALLHTLFQAAAMSAATWQDWGGITMAHSDTDYQRLEASYSDSPPGEENLLMHVPEGAKCKCKTFIIHIHSRPLPWS